MEKRDLEDEIVISVNYDESDVALERFCRIFRSIRTYTKQTINYPTSDIRYMRQVKSGDVNVGYFLTMGEKNISLFIGNDMNTVITFKSLGRHGSLLPNNLAGLEYYSEAKILDQNDILPEIMEFIEDYQEYIP